MGLHRIALSKVLRERDGRRHLKSVNFVRGAEVLPAQAEVESERVRQAVCVTDIEVVVVLDESTDLRRTGRQIAAIAVEQVGMEVVVNEAEYHAHAIGGGSGVIDRQSSVGADRIVDVGAESDEFG